MHGIRAWQSARQLHMVAVADASVRGYTMRPEPALNGPSGYLWHVALDSADEALAYLCALEGDGFAVELLQWSNHEGGDVLACASKEERVNGHHVRSVIRVWFNCGALDAYPTIAPVVPVRQPR